MAIAVASVVGSPLMLSVGQADPLDDRHKELQAAISQTKEEMSESSSAAEAAAVALTKAESELSIAQEKLAQTQLEVAAAQKKDDELARKLKLRREQLAKAKAAVIRGQKRLAKQKAMVGSIVRDQFQHQSNLLPLAVLTTSTSASDMQKRLQLSRTMLDTNQVEFEKLTKIQQQLAAEKKRQARLERQVAAAKKESAENLKTKQQLEQQAASEKATVAELVEQREAAEATAKKEAEADKTRYADLKDEDARVQQRIAERIAREKAEAERRAAAEKARKEAAEAKAAAEAAKKRERERKHHDSDNNSGGGNSGGGGSSGGGSNSGGGGSSGGGSSSSHGFIYPVNAPITSPYGMRFHPVLHYWKLHDGTDFGAGCGTAIHAPYSGRVAERYFNAGYGNRLIIDHGKVDGHYISTAMNHAIRYTVGVGEHVSQGEVIGYVGTTGYSTGCHMHLMVYKDGNRINPMSWY